ncbi:type V CRISPR-associated protein Cas12a/Cpf1 [Candidatus Kaiserbacteria bacterium]|nr:type V CRISPR-associated protein Cas12a/Cpf1 [Candidatus Kaiserbacteria bacterium]
MTQRSPVSGGKNPEGQKSVFDSFTHKYALSKTLRFELVPQGKTSESLKAVFEEDKKVEENYQKTKVRLDQLHRLFVQASFTESKVSALKLASFVRAYNALIGVAKKTQTKEQKSAYEKERKALLYEVAGLFDEMGDEWKAQYEEIESVGRTGKQKKIKFSSTGCKILTDEAVLNILMDKFAEDTQVFSTFFGFFTYFGKFNETRENFYKSDGTSTAVATRVVENLEKFLRNKHIVESEYKKVKTAIGLTDSEILALTDVEAYHRCFLQAGIDVYNTVLGGSTELEQSVNKKVNEYRQKTGNKISFLAKLHNQILSEKDVFEMLVIKGDAQLWEKLKVFSEENVAYCTKMLALIRDALTMPEKSGYEWSKIYFSSGAINTISSKYFTNWSVLKGALLDAVGTAKGGGGELPDFVSLQHVQNALDVNEINKGKKPSELFRSEILKHAAFVESVGHFTNLITILLSELDARVAESAVDLADLKKDSFWTTGALSQRRKEKEDEGTIQINRISAYLNSCRDAHRMIKYFATENRRDWVEPEEGYDPKFYDAYREEYAKDIFFPLYNVARNFLTQKPSDENKVKLNFECGTLLSGWDKNKEQEKLGIILRKDGAYYLAIMRKQFSDILEEKKHPEAYRAGDNGYSKMEYKLFPDPKRMIPKVAFAETNKKTFGWTPEVQAIKDEYAKFQESKKEDQSAWKNQFDANKTARLIAYYQNCLAKGGYQETFGLTWKKPEEYVGIGEFNDHIAQQNYKIKFVPVDADYIDEHVAKGEMYLFKIKSKDFASGSTGTKNVHSLYFSQLFSEANLAQTPTVVQLAGNAEIFYREASVEPEKEKRNFPRDITKYKRFTEDKVFFHVPIKINAGTDAMRSQYQFNKILNAELIAKRAKDFCIIGIDRGEKHLAYYSVINQKGVIVDEGSLNEISGTDYHKLLDGKEKERTANRQAWLPVRQIKDLKRGYVSHAVKKICDLAIEHNAIIVLENLNMRFKQIRSGIEKSVYQQLEKQLVDKLGHMVFKDRPELEIGGVLNGYQLAAPFESFKDMGNQTGIVFYTEAAYTSTTDPVTGFRKNVYVSNSATKEKLEKAIKSFDAIGWNEERQSYFITYDPVRLVDKKEKTKTISKLWTVYADVPRIRRERNEQGVWNARNVNPNDMFKSLFEAWNFEDKIATDLKSKIEEKMKNGELSSYKMIDGRERNFFQAFIYIFNIILDIRNSSDKTDFIASPVAPFFTTLNAPKPNPCDINLANGDSLGAYNIARKGIITIGRINDNPEKPDLYISKEQWDEWATKHGIQL